MNCAERLVEMFGSQAEVARAFQLDRAVVHHWVKLGYVPARWAGEVERITDGRISAGDTSCSLLLVRVAGGGGGIMPPGAPLSEAERCALETWVRNGAAR